MPPKIIRSEAFLTRWEASLPQKDRYFDLKDLLDFTEISKKVPIDLMT